MPRIGLVFYVDNKLRVTKVIKIVSLSCIKDQLNLLKGMSLCTYSNHVSFIAENAASPKITTTKRPLESDNEYMTSPKAMKENLPLSHLCFM